MTPLHPLIIPVRGRVYLAPLGAEDDAEMKYWLCVSNSFRNPRLDEFLAVRLTTTLRDFASWVRLTPNDAPFVGCVNCDDLGPIFRGQVIKDCGALSRATMTKVNRAMMVALGISD